MLHPIRESIFWRNGDILHDLLSWQAPVSAGIMAGNAETVFCSWRGFFEMSQVRC